MSAMRSRSYTVRQGCTHHNFSLLHATSLDNDRVLRCPPLVSTGLSETDVIFGGEGALERTLDEVIARNPGAVFVLSTCIVDTIGDDVGMVCGSRPGAGHRGADQPGFLGGSFQAGVNNALNALPGLAEPTGGNGRVNIIGEKNLEYEVDENFAEVSRLLALLDLPVNIRFVHDLATDRIASLGAARLNVLRGSIPLFPSVNSSGSGSEHRLSPRYPVGISGTIGFLECGSRCMRYRLPSCGGFRSVRSSRRPSTISRILREPGYHLPPSRQTLKGIGRRRILHGLLLRLDVTSSGHPVPVPVTPPIGITGVHRMLHRWRRVLHA